MISRFVRRKKKKLSDKSRENGIVPDDIKRMEKDSAELVATRVR